MEFKIEQPEFQKIEKLKTEKPKMTFEKLKERYEEFVSRKKPSRPELKGLNYTLHTYKEPIQQIVRVKELDDFRKLSTYLDLSSNYIEVVERDKAKSKYYLSIGAYNYFFNIYTKPLQFELYVKIDGCKASYAKIHNIELEAEFDMTADVLQKKEPIKQNSVKVFISYVPGLVIYQNQEGIIDSVMNWIDKFGARRLFFRSNDPNKPTKISHDDSLRDSLIYGMYRNTILSNAYTLSLDIDKNSGQKDPLLKGLIDLAQNPADPNTYSIIKPLFDKIEEQMVDIMLKKYQNYRNLFIGATIFVFVIDPAKQDNMQILVVPSYLSIKLDDSRYRKFIDRFIADTFTWYYK